MEARESPSEETKRPTAERTLPRVLETGAAAVHLFVDDRIEPDPRALEQLEALGRATGVQSPVVALPDVHYKARNPAPTGTVVAVRDAIIPRALDAGLNCGMRVHLLDLRREDVATRHIERLFALLGSIIPIGWHPQPVLSEFELDEVLARGARWVVDRHDGRGGPVANIENEGVLTSPDERRSIHALLRRRARRNLGVLGSGNHFLELHVIDEVPAGGEALGLEPGRLLVMMHSGSGVVGKTMGLFFGPRDERVGRSQRRFLVEKTAYHVAGGRLREDPRRFFREDGFDALPADGREGRRFLAAHAAAANFGYANRAALGAKVEQAVARIFAGAGAPLLTDISHNLVQREQHDGQDVYVHRQGASRAVPASLTPAGSPFAVTGQPFPVPGSMGAAAYICVAGPDAAAALRSANHGAGRVLDKPEARLAYDEAGVRAELGEAGIMLFKAGGGRLEEQAPGAFKDVTAVIEVMTASGIAAPWRGPHPLAVLKG